MLHHERVKPPIHDYPPDEWNLIERNYHPEFIAQMESVLASGNGYLGMRGGPEEGGPAVQNGTFVNGFYESWPIIYGQDYGFARNGQTMLNVTDCKIIKLIIDDEPFWLATAKLIHFERKLNMKAGTLDRDVVWETPSGTQVNIKSRRLISFQQSHVAAISYEVTLLNAAKPVVISSELFAPQPGEQIFEDDPRQSRFFRNALRPIACYPHDRRIILVQSTEHTRLMLSCGIDHEFESDCPHYYKVIHADDFGQVAFTTDAQPGHPIRLTKYITYHTSPTASPNDIRRRAEWTLDRVVRQGFTKLLAEQQEFLDDFWRRSDVQVSNVSKKSRLSAIELQQAIRLNLFHVLQASAKTDGHGIPARGLTSQAYEGHYFRDTEIYVLPFLTYTSPHSAKNILLVRYNMLDKARVRAHELSHAGALFPWRTINGEEASAYYEAGTAQYHINADIAYALRKYVNTTGDEEFLFQYGAEILVETARFWYDLGFFSTRKGGKFCINGVRGPDEYTAVVNNNTYTNLMARENLRYAVRTVELLQKKNLEALQALMRRTGLELSELQGWKNAADNMYVPFDAATGIYPQDDSFLEREPWDFKNTAPNKYPLLLFYHPLNIYRHQVIKQADVILAMFLLGNEFTPEAKRRNFDFYDPLTTGDSSLSSCIEAIVALEIGEYEKAFTYARAALLMDLADVGGNVKDGCHIATMGAGWMALTYGFGGLRDYDGSLSFRPNRPPEAHAVLRFPLTYRDRHFTVEISPETTTYSLQDGNELTLRHNDEALTLTPADPTVSRPTSKPTMLTFDGDRRQ